MADMTFDFDRQDGRRQAAGQVRKLGLDHEFPDDTPDSFPLRVTGVPDHQVDALKSAVRNVDPGARMRHDT